MHQRQGAIGLAILMAIGWFAIAPPVPCKAAAIDLTTPAGLMAGDQFHFAFVTSGTTAGDMGNVAFYNTFVNNDAAGATYNGAAVRWYALVATTGNMDPLQGLEDSSPVYQAADGAKVGTQLNRILNMYFLGPNPPGKLTLDLNNNDWSDSRAWTGLDSLSAEGLVPASRLGADNPYYGIVGAGYSDWFFKDTAPKANEYHIYAFSELLTVPRIVPEPSTLIMMSLGATIAAGSLLIRRREAHRR